VAKDDGTVDAEDNERFSEKFGLLAGTPSRTVRTITISKARTVERNYAMPRSE
jgi:hypothetical protein